MSAVLSFARSLADMMGEGIRRKILLVVLFMFGASGLIFVANVLLGKQTLQLLEKTGDKNFPGLMSLDHALSALDSYQLRMGDAIGQMEPDYLAQAETFGLQMEQALEDVIGRFPDRALTLREQIAKWKSFRKSNSIWAGEILQQRIIFDPTDSRAVQYQTEVQVFQTILKDMRQELYQSYQDDFRRIEFLTALAIKIGVFLLVLSLVAAFVSLHYTQKKIVSPVTILAATSKVVQQGEFREPPPWKSRDEIGQLNRNFTAMIRSLAEASSKLEGANVALQKSVDNLKHEAQSRTSMVEDLAHRCNNPIHACRLDLEILAEAIRKIDEVITQMLGAEEDLDSDAKNFLDSFHQMTKNIADCNLDAKVNLNRAADAIKEIRVLSGVDGHLEEWVSLTDILTLTWKRLETNLGQELEQRFQINNFSREVPPLLSNPTILVVCLERFLRKYLRSFDQPSSLHTSFRDMEPGKTRYEFRFEPFTGEWPSGILDLVLSLDYILEQEQVHLSLDPDGILSLDGISPKR